MEISFCKIITTELNLFHKYLVSLYVHLDWTISGNFHDGCVDISDELVQPRPSTSSTRALISVTYKVVH